MSQYPQEQNLSGRQIELTKQAILQINKQIDDKICELLAQKAMLKTNPSALLSKFS